MAARGICVTTRRAWKVQMQELDAQSLPPPSPQSYPPTSSPDSLSARSSPLTDTSDFDFPSPSRETSVSASSSSKRLRTPSLVDAPTIVRRPRKIKKRASTSAYTSRSSSIGESRQISVALDEPIYRSDRSRSTSVFPPAVDLFAREWWSLDDRSPGDGFVSAADVVRKLAKSYKSCEFTTRGALECYSPRARL